jgi:hypothetical protein
LSFRGELEEHADPARSALHAAVVMVLANKQLNLIEDISRPCHIIPRCGQRLIFLSLVSIAHPRPFHIYMYIKNYLFKEW